MRLILAAVALLPCLSTAALAQRSLFYWYLAPGGVTSSGSTQFTAQMGGGGELAIAKGVSVGIEAGAVGLWHHFTDSVLGEASVNGYYHFRHSRQARWDPFVTGGYSLFFRRGASNLGNFGGGLNYWFADHLAFRAEFRDQVSGGPAAVHYWGARFGLSFTHLSP
jgi:hypothetical protein